MPTQLSFIEPVTEGGHMLTMKDGWKLEQILDVKHIGPDLQWSIVVSREVPDA